MMREWIFLGERAYLVFKIGDIIHPKDANAAYIKFKIVGDASPEWDAWYVEPLHSYRGLFTPLDEDEAKYEPRHKKTDKTMVFKDDDRWVLDTNQTQ